jgi:hypothetical protein
LLTVITFAAHHREAPEIYRLDRRTYKHMATANGLHSTAGTVHSRYYSKQITRQFETALYIVMQKTVIINSYCIGRKFVAE